MDFKGSGIGNIPKKCHFFVVASLTEQEGNKKTYSQNQWQEGNEKIRPQIGNFGKGNEKIRSRY